MVKKYQLEIAGTCYTVVMSDESEALHAALAAGSAVIGLWHPDTGQNLAMAHYLVERPEDADRQFLEKVVRRTNGLPLLIAETERLQIREFQLSDAGQIPAEPEDREDDRIFSGSDLLEAYICSQYGFFEYGIWALTEKESGGLIGKAGITGAVRPKNQTESGLELGYHIFEPYRNQGYAYEACRAILRYVEQEFAPRYLYIKTASTNAESVRLAEKLGFKKLKESKYNEGVISLLRFAENC